MGSEQFTQLVKKIVAEYANEQIAPSVATPYSVNV